jgi:hypothetical protein
LEWDKESHTELVRNGQVVFSAIPALDMESARRLRVSFEAGAMNDSSPEPTENDG